MQGKTTLPKIKDIKREWYEVDASRLPLGRLASQVAQILRGKHKPIFTPHLDVGDFVVVTNPEKVRLTGRKLEQKQYYRFSGYPGGLKTKRLKDELNKRPDRVIEHAVRLMLPKNRLQSQQLRRLKIVKGDKHSYKIDQRLTNNNNQ